MEIKSDWGVSFCQIGDFEHIDMMTGLRNQIAFFRRCQKNHREKAEVNNHFNRNKKACRD